MRFESAPAFLVEQNFLQFFEVMRFESASNFVVDDCKTFCNSTFEFQKPFQFCSSWLQNFLHFTFEVIILKSALNFVIQPNKQVFEKTKI